MPYNITSLQRLRCYQLPSTYADADAYLCQRREKILLIAIHLKYFPTELPIGWEMDQDKLLPQDEDPYSEVELHCLKLIDDTLFPFALDHLLECADEGERLSTIPLYPYGIDRWERPFSDFDPGWQILLQLVDPIEEDGIELGAEARAILSQATRTGRLSLRRMDDLCQSEEEPVRALPTAMRMIEHSTENAFLDATDEMPCEDMFWDLDDVALLAEHWKAAQTMTDRTEALAEWLVTAPQNIKKAVDLWNRSLVQG